MSSLPLSPLNEDSRVIYRISTHKSPRATISITDTYFLKPEHTLWAFFGYHRNARVQMILTDKDNSIYASAVANSKRAEERKDKPYLCGAYPADIEHLLHPQPVPEETTTTCCLCLNPLGDLYGNNPWPLVGDKCCDSCNINKVIPARIARGKSDPDTESE